METEDLKIDDQMRKQLEMHKSGLVETLHYLLPGHNRDKNSP